MTRARRAVLPALLLALLAVGPAAAAPSRHGDPVLLALGDSVAAGVGAAPAPGYPVLVAKALSEGYNPRAGKATPNASTHFTVVDLAAPGATTVDLTAPSGQVERAVALIGARQDDRDPKNDVEVITLTVGGNDVFRPVLRACLTPTTPSTCQAVTSARLAQVGVGVQAALRRLGAAGGKRTEIVVTTYYDSLVGACPDLPDSPVVRALAQQLAETVLLGGTSGSGLTVRTGLNALIQQAAARTGAQVADLYGVVGRDQLVGDCLHPNADGHAVIADEVVATLVQ